MNFLEFECRPFFKTAASVGFKLYESFQPPNIAIPTASRLVGKLDVHYPAEGHIKVYLRVLLLEEKGLQLDQTTLKNAIELLIRQMAIPEHVTFEADVYSFNSYRTVENRVDDRGYVDGAAA